MGETTIKKKKIVKILWTCARWAHSKSIKRL